MAVKMGRLTDVVHPRRFAPPPPAGDICTFATTASGGYNAPFATTACAGYGPLGQNVKLTTSSSLVSRLAIAHCPLPIAHCPLPIAHCALPFAVKFISLNNHRLHRGHQLFLHLLEMLVRLRHHQPFFMRFDGIHVALVLFDHLPHLAQL